MRTRSLNEPSSDIPGPLVRYDYTWGKNNKHASVIFLSAKIHKFDIFTEGKLKTLQQGTLIRLFGVSIDIKMQFFRFSVTFEPNRFLRSVHYHGLFCNNITEFYMFNKNRTFINYPLSYHMYMFIRYVCFYLMILFQYLAWAYNRLYSALAFWSLSFMWFVWYPVVLVPAQMIETIFKTQWEGFWSNFVIP